VIWTAPLLHECFLYSSSYAAILPSASLYGRTGQAYVDSFDMFKLNIPWTVLSYERLPQQCQKPLKCLSLIKFKREWISGTDITDLSIAECVRLGPHHVCIPISPACDPHQPHSPAPSGNATLIQNKLPANLLHKNYDRNNRWTALVPA